MAGPPPEPTELLYPPRDSWAPVVVALGLGLAAFGIFGGWAWAAIGAVAVLLGARAWWKQDDEEISRMRREQRTGTAVIPAESVRRPS
jgi:hypothetical protein